MLPFRAWQPLAGNEFLLLMPSTNINIKSIFAAIAWNKQRSLISAFKYSPPPLRSRPSPPPPTTVNHRAAGLAASLKPLYAPSTTTLWLREPLSGFFLGTRTTPRRHLTPPPAALPYATPAPFNPRGNTGPVDGIGRREQRHLAAVQAERPKVRPHSRDPSRTPPY